MGNHMKGQTKLDLIVTHYTEPWTLGQKFFDMLCLQRGINFSDFHVIVVQDGADGIRELDGIEEYPLDIDVLHIPHSGVSVARNAGLKSSKAEWVMFCDFDDMFSCMYSIRRFFENMSNAYDMVYSHIYNEVDESDGTYSLEPIRANDIFIHAKMFRRSFLLDNGITFEPGVSYSEDALFCKTVDTVIDWKRKKEIPEVLYLRAANEDSVCRNEENRLRNARSLFRARCRLAAMYYDHDRIRNFTGTIVKTVFDYYYACIGNAYPIIAWFENDFRAFWKLYKEVFLSADDELLRYENRMAFDEATSKGFITIPEVSFQEWLKQMTNEET